MAHFKHKRPRALHSGGYSSKGLKNRIGAADDGMSWLRHWPRSHDILFHTRPLRRRIKAMEKAVLQGADTEDMAWPLSKKPHVYYW